MITFEVFKLRVLRVLDDLDRDNPTWTDDDLLDYANEALAALSMHTAQQVVVDSVLTADTSSYAMPDGYLSPGPVWLISGTYRYLLTPFELEPGQDLPTQVVSGRRTEYYEWPAGTLSFLRPLASGDTLRLQYYAYWDRLEVDSDTLAIPRWMEDALKWDMLQRAMSKPGAQASSLGQYKTKRDLGNPEDNPLLDYAKWCQKQFDRVWNEHAPQDRTVWMTS